MQRREIGTIERCGLDWPMQPRLRLLSERPQGGVDLLKAPEEASLLADQFELGAGVTSASVAGLPGLWPKKVRVSS